MWKVIYLVKGQHEEYMTKRVTQNHELQVGVGLQESSQIYKIQYAVGSKTFSPVTARDFFHSMVSTLHQLL